jgi:hypothetical protein
MFVACFNFFYSYFVYLHFIFLNAFIYLFILFYFSKRFYFFSDLFCTCTSLQIGIHLFHMNVWSVNTTLQRGAFAKVEFHFANRCMCNGCAWAMGECDFAKRGMCNGWMLLCKDAQMVTAILQRGTMCSGWTLLCKKAHMQTVNATLHHVLYRKVLGE